jgi:PilZ domain
MNDSAERRASPRFEISAQARVVSGGETCLLKVSNISAAGAFLEGRARDHADLVPGVEIEVVISTTAPAKGDDELITIDEVINIECRGRVVRRELRTPASPGGFGITLEPKTAEDRERLEDLLGRLIDLAPAQRPASLG